MTEAEHRQRWTLWATVVGVVLAVVGAVLIASGDRIAGASEPAEAQQVVRVSNDFAVAYNTYDVADVEDYKSRLEGLLTDEYREQAFSVIDAIFGALEEKQQSSGDAEVLSTAVATLDEDSAQTLVAVDATIRNTDTEDAGVQRHFRWKLNLVKDGDDWKVENFESVASVEASAVPQGGAGATDEGGPE
ncbi:hypothetical protein D9V41_05005 [Aeromicrobium phragmitis]|uniref:Mce-associated membrane protein n=1 Tax=Aeromicrobium phragmitis TaxID=2478914 RepID=A0A3L8PPR6_9ACTN|nr:hypothetical protein D9V41_05005 [Aeromicrobium phragmitis]